VRERLRRNIAREGDRFRAGPARLGKERGVISNVRGLGSLVAFTLESPEIRSQAAEGHAREALPRAPVGDRSIRFRLPLSCTKSEIETALERIATRAPDDTRAGRDAAAVTQRA
jgi:L-lysine 6-transaminase